MTTIFAIRHNDKMAIAGDGQVTLGNQVVMKHTAKKSAGSLTTRL